MPIRIEMGRFTNLKVEEQVCQVCDIKVPETESHFVFSCPLYTKLGVILFQQLSKCRENFCQLDEANKWFTFLGDKMCLKYTTTSVLDIQEDS